MNKNRVRVVVTGIGVVSPIGHGKIEFGQSLRRGVSGIRHINRLAELNFSCRVGGVPQNMDQKRSHYFSEAELASMNESITYGTIAAIDAFRDAGLAIPDCYEDFVYEDTGAIIGTGIGGLDTFAERVYPLVNQGRVKRLGSTIVERIMMSSVSAKIGGVLALGNQVSTNSAACSTGLEAIIMGTERIKAGLAQRMVVGGAEEAIHIYGQDLILMKVLCRTYNEKPEKASRPMSQSAAGFVPGSGAAVLVIENLQIAKARGAPIYAEIIAGRINSGGMRFGGSMTAPSSKGVQRCIRETVLSAGIDSKDIDYINGHLTATMADSLEMINWAEGLGVSAEHFPYINSTKSLIGHGLGAAGALESVATLIQMDQGFIHGSLNCEDLHCDIEPFKNRIVQSSINTKINIAMKASFGFGDVNSSLIFKKLEE